MTFYGTVSELTSDRPALVVGIDPHPHVLEMWGLKDSASGLQEFTRAILDQFSEAQGILAKPQVALFERHGLAGLALLHELLGGLRHGGIPAIGDAKRGDIGSTMKAYADAWLLPGADFEVDALTVSPFLGVGSLHSALDLALENSKGLFVLAATSNPEALTLQSAHRHDGRTVAAGVVWDVAAWSDPKAQAHESGIGFVVGATVDQDALGLELENHPSMPILAPGYGFQGASLGDSKQHFPHTKHLLPVVARSILEGPREKFLERLEQAQAELRSR
jgi:orotidine-5'-phosphate decarboxylase